MVEKFLAIVASIALLLSGLFGQESHASNSESNNEHVHYSTCPDFEHAVVRSVGYSY